jgi:murein tripeptide amidase MpaA
MKKNALTVIFLLSSFIAILNAAPTQKIQIIEINLTQPNKSSLEKLFTLGLDITNFDEEQKRIFVLASTQELEKISEIGIQAKVVIPDANLFARRLRQTDYFSHFQNYNQMLSTMQQIVQDHPGIAQLIDIGDSFEKTVGKGGYDIWVLKISDNVLTEENEPEVFYMANTHAREIITPEIILHFMHYLADNYNHDPTVTYLINNRVFYLCPTINPDGHEYVLTGSNIYNTELDPIWWRKNKQDNNKNGIFEPTFDGVDLNRNFGYTWGYDDIGSSPSPFNAVYRGGAPFSEPETQAVRDFTLAHHFKISLSFHSHGRWWIFPWCYLPIDAYTPDHRQFQALADSCVAYNHYTPANGNDFSYVTNGSSDDWFYGEQKTKNKIFGFTPEVGYYEESLYGWTGFFPDTAYIQKQIMENQGPMIYLAYAVGEEPIIKAYPMSHDPTSLGPFNLEVTILPAIPLTDSIGLNPESYKLFYGNNNQASFDSTSLAPTDQPDHYIGTIPFSGEDMTISYYFAAADSAGRIGHAPRSAPLSTFQIKVPRDITPPTIEHQPVADQSSQTSAIVFKADIVDNYLFQMPIVTLYYRQHSASFDSIGMEPTLLENEYVALLSPRELTENELVEYYIQATDGSLNANSAVVPSEGYYSFRMTPNYSYDLDFNNGGFYTNPPSDWQWGVPTAGPLTAFSGTKVWATNLNGHYSMNSNSWLQLPPIDLNGMSGASLTFWHWYQNDYYEDIIYAGGNVKISVDGDSAQLIIPSDGYDGIIDSNNKFIKNEPVFGGRETNGNYWHQETFDLTPFVNHNITLWFQFVSDIFATQPGWYIDDVSITSTPTAINPKIKQNIPGKFELWQNYPNPFSGTGITIIKYKVPTESFIVLQIYNLIGQTIKTIQNTQKSSGNYTDRWDGTDDNGNIVPAGVYLCRMAAGNEKRTMKIILLR